MNNTAALNLLKKIAARGIDIAVEKGILTPGASSADDAHKVGMVAIVAAANVEPQIMQALQAITLERLQAGVA